MDKKVLRGHHFFYLKSMHLCRICEIKAVPALPKRIIFLLLQPASEEEGLVNEKMKAPEIIFK